MLGLRDRVWRPDGGLLCLSCPPANLLDIFVIVAITIKIIVIVPLLIHAFILMLVNIISIFIGPDAVLVPLSLKSSLQSSSSSRPSCTLQTLVHIAAVPLTSSSVSLEGNQGHCVQRISLLHQWSLHL